MSLMGAFQIALFAIVLTALVKPVGSFTATRGMNTGLSPRAVPSESRLTVPP